MPGELKARLLAGVALIDGVEARPSPVAGGTCLVHHGREFAHFHDDGEIDLHLTRGVIAELGMAHPAGSRHHPARSPRSPWIEVRFGSEAEVDRAVELVRLATQVPKRRSS